MKLLLVFAVWSFAGWLLLWMGLSNRRDWRRRDEEETADAEAVVVDHVTRKRTGRGGGTYHLPVVRYTVDGVEYVQPLEFAYDPKELPVGKAVPVRYNPHDPARFHPNLAELRHRNTNSMINIGLIWILVSLAGALVLNSLSGGYGLDILSSLGLRGRRFF